MGYLQHKTLSSCLSSHRNDQKTIIKLVHVTCALHLLKPYTNIL